MQSHEKENSSNVQLIISNKVVVFPPYSTWLLGVEICRLPLRLIVSFPSLPLSLKLKTIFCHFVIDSKAFLNLESLMSLHSSKEECSSKLKVTATQWIDLIFFPCVGGLSGTHLITKELSHTLLLNWLVLTVPVDLVWHTVINQQFDHTDFQQQNPSQKITSLRFLIRKDVIEPLQGRLGAGF